MPPHKMSIWIKTRRRGQKCDIRSAGTDAALIIFGYREIFVQGTATKSLGQQLVRKGKALVEEQIHITWANTIAMRTRDSPLKLLTIETLKGEVHMEKIHEESNTIY